MVFFGGLGTCEIGIQEELADEFTHPGALGVLVIDLEISCVKTRHLEIQGGKATCDFHLKHGSGYGCFQK